MLYKGWLPIKATFSCSLEWPLYTGLTVQLFSRIIHHWDILVFMKEVSFKAGLTVLWRNLEKSSSKFQYRKGYEKRLFVYNSWFSSLKCPLTLTPTKVKLVPHVDSFLFTSKKCTIACCKKVVFFKYFISLLMLNQCFLWIWLFFYINILTLIT
jgi:hypothetical protein